MAEVFQVQAGYGSTFVTIYLAGSFLETAALPCKNGPSIHVYKQAINVSWMNFNNCCYF